MLVSFQPISGSASKPACAFVIDIVFHGLLFAEATVCRKLELISCNTLQKFDLLKQICVGMVCTVVTRSAYASDNAALKTLNVFIEYVKEQCVVGREDDTL